MQSNQLATSLGTKLVCLPTWSLVLVVSCVSLFGFFAISVLAPSISISISICSWKTQYQCSSLWLQTREPVDWVQWLTPKGLNQSIWSTMSLTIKRWCELKSKLKLTSLHLLRSASFKVAICCFRFKFSNKFKNKLDEQFRAKHQIYMRGCVYRVLIEFVWAVDE